MKNIKFSFLSRRKAVLGISVNTMDGMKANRETGEISKVTHVGITIGVLFAYVKFEFLANESEPIELGDNMKSLIKTIEAAMDEEIK